MWMACSHGDTRRDDFCVFDKLVSLSGQCLPSAGADRFSQYASELPDGRNFILLGSPFDYRKQSPKQLGGFGCHALRNISDLLT